MKTIYLAQMLLMLGARGNISGSANFDDYVENGYYGVSRSNSYSNSPTTSFAGTLIVFNTKDTNYTNALSQYAYNVDLGEMYYRIKWAGTWQSWIRIDNFGCSTPAELASLLGGEAYPSIENLNTTTQGKFLYFQNTPNAPSTNPGILECMKFGGGLTIHRASERNPNSNLVFIYTRCGYMGSGSYVWGAWKQISYTT